MNNDGTAKGLMLGMATVWSGRNGWLTCFSRAETVRGVERDHEKEPNLCQPFPVSTLHHSLAMLQRSYGLFECLMILYMCLCLFISIYLHFIHTESHAIMAFSSRTMNLMETLELTQFLVSVYTGMFMFWSRRWRWMLIWASSWPWWTSLRLTLTHSWRLAISVMRTVRRHIPRPRFLDNLWNW